MFGTLKTHSCTLDSGGQREHGRFYCGLCKTLGSEFGQALRVTLSYDAVFMAILADAVQDIGAVPASYRCPLVPVHHRPAVSHDSPAMRYAAAVQVLLGDQWLADRGADGRRLARLTRPLLQAPVARAQGLLRNFGVDVGALEGVERRQQAVEAGHPTPREAAMPTSAALGLVFAAVADLPGTRAAARTDAARRSLAALGSTVGRVIYLTDALEDIPQDRRKGSFNPCLVGDVVVPERLRNACEDLGSALKRMSALVATLPWRRHREVIANILCDRLAGQSRRAIAAARFDGDGMDRPLRARDRDECGNFCSDCCSFFDHAGSCCCGDCGYVGSGNASRGSNDGGRSIERADCGRECCNCGGALAPCGVVVPCEALALCVAGAGAVALCPGVCCNALVADCRCCNQ